MEKNGEDVQDLKAKAAKDSYSYDISDEKFLMGFSGKDGVTLGKITLNHYESEVLNTTTMLFTDIDIGDPQVEDGCLIDSEAPAIAALKQIVEFANRKSSPSWIYSIRQFFRRDRKPLPIMVAHCTKSSSSDIGFRVYRTKGGLRVLCATHKFCPRNSDDFMRFMYTDPRYRRLCKKQGIFRARITPKKWRLVSGCEDDAKTCGYVKTIGSAAILPEFDRMVTYHDRVTKSFKNGGYLA